MFYYHFVVIQRNEYSYFIFVLLERNQPAGPGFCCQATCLSRYIFNLEISRVVKQEDLSSWNIRRPMLYTQLFVFSIFVCVIETRIGIYSIKEIMSFTKAAACVNN